MAKVTTVTRANRKVTKQAAAATVLDESQVPTSTSEAVAEARECIRRAADLLRPLGIEYGRLAWMLEDSLAYIEEAQLVPDAVYSDEKLEESSSEGGLSIAAWEQLIKNLPE